MSDQILEPQGHDESADESSVIKDLRKQLRAAEARAKESDEKALAAAEFISDLNKERIQQVMDTAGIEGLAPDKVASEIEGIATAEKVVDVLKAFGHKLQAPAPDEDKAVEEPVSQPAGADLAAVAGIGQRVADAAGGGKQRDSMQRLAESEGPEDVIAQMAEEGLTVSYA